MSFSLHAAQTRGGQIYYFLLFAITLPLFYLFVIEWFTPTLELGAEFNYLVTAGVLGQLLAVLVPATPGRKEQIHNLGAYLMAATMIPASILIALSHPPLFVSAVAATGAVYMIGASFLFLFVKRSHAYFLYFQAAYIAMFHVIIISSTYV